MARRAAYGDPGERVRSVSTKQADRGSHHVTFAVERVRLTMPKIGLTATNANAAERSVPSPQPPSVLPSVSGYRLPVRSGTMASNDGSNGVSMEATVSSTRKDRDANVAEAANAARRNVLPAVRPEVPECFPERSPSLFPKQEWAGRVTAVNSATFRCPPSRPDGRWTRGCYHRPGGGQCGGPCPNARRFALPLGNGVREDRQRHAEQRFENRIPGSATPDQARP